MAGRFLCVDCPYCILTGHYNSFLSVLRKNETVRPMITTSATASEIGAAYRIPLMPLPDCYFSIIAGKSSTSGTKHTISRTNDAIMAWADLPMDWKNTAVIFTRQVTTVKER